MTLKKCSPMLCLTMFLALLTACDNYRPDSKLVLADSLLNGNPDSAMAVLAGIKPESLASEKDKRYHALLTAESRYKSGIDDTDTSMISPAVRFYDPDVDNPLRARAYFCKGIIEYNDSDYSN